MSIGLIITAAGTSSRFDSKENKLFTLIHSIPVIIHTLRAFQNISDISQIVITTHPDHKAKLDSLLKSETLIQPYTVIVGGKTRKDSVQLGFNQLKNISSVMIHDAARPCCSKDLIQRLIHAHKTYPAVIPGISMTDTIKRVENGVVQETLDRTTLYRIQTPQVFSKPLLQNAYDTPETADVTDEARLIEMINEPVTVIDGDPQNIKLTTIDDIKNIEDYLT